MTLDRATGTIEHRVMGDLPALLSRRNPKPLLVFNNSKVRKARLFARSPSGVRAEFLLLDSVDRLSWRAMTKRRKTGRYLFDEGRAAEITARLDDGLCSLRFDEPVDEAWFDRCGHIPLPPYLKRGDETADGERYQTVYADAGAGSAFGPGASAAAPTAGLHFTPALLDALDAAGMERVFITLHVGLGTFLPVRAERVEDHRMHSEAFTISVEAAERINAAAADGRPVMAVGTTSVRALESAFDGNAIASGGAATSIFIYPGYTFKVVSGMITNFHTPGSSLLMLTAAFAAKNGCGKTGRDMILESYARALREGYRFFSYGDAMLIR